MLWLFPFILYANPDDFGFTFTDNRSSDGPPFAILDLTQSFELSISADETTSVDLPFSWWWYDQYYEVVDISSNGVIFFEGSTTSPYHGCIGDDFSWSGIAGFWDDWDQVVVHYGEFGAYPYRVFAVEWSGDHLLGGYGAVQVWLMEGGGSHPETVIVLDDITFGNSLIDGGAQALIGIQHTISGTGVEWGCASILNDISTAWFGRAGYRASAPSRQSTDLDAPWVGIENYQYLGRTIAMGELDGDGLADVVVGNQDSDQVFILYGKSPWVGADIDQAEVQITGPSHFGSSILLRDLDGDGLDELIVGAQKANNNEGAVYVFTSTNFSSNVLSHADASLELLSAPSMGSAMLGSALAAEDFDGDGVVDLAVGGYRSNEQVASSGAVYIWSGADNMWTGSQSISEANIILQADGFQDWVGYSLAAADLDGDGISELAVGAPLVDSISSNGGSVYVLSLPGYSGAYNIETEAIVEISGAFTDSKAGSSVALGDIDGDGAGDLAVGAPFGTGSYSQSGFVYLFWDILSWSGVHETTEADVEIEGSSSASHLGETIAISDVNGDGQSDLIVAAPNTNTVAAGGGGVGIFSDIDSSEQTFLDADNIVYGAHSAGALGASVAVGGDVDGDGIMDVIMGAPYADTGYTMGGRIFRWYYGTDFVDFDADGFVPTYAGGLDCDDTDPLVFPSQIEDLTNKIDDDCDGWIDDVVMFRPKYDWWEFEAEAAGMLHIDTYDFESGILGANASSAYVSTGLSMFASDSVIFSDGVFGSASRGNRSLKVYDDGFDNELRLYFDDGVEAMGFYLLDGDGDFEITASFQGTILFENILWHIEADNVPSGRYMGFLFPSSIDYVSIRGELDDGFGLDDLSVVWSSETDIDGDGYTEVQGDCDDANPNIHPGMTEDLSNGIDDDCDGAVDGGSLQLFTDEVLWQDSLSFIPQQIDFEDMTLSFPITNQYAVLGVRFDGALAAEESIDGALPIDSLAAKVTGDTTTVTFTELQSSLSFYAVDVASELRIKGYADGVLLYNYPISVYSEETAIFVGVSFDYGVDTLEIISEVALDEWGIDNFVLGALGLDDADGDGLTEAEGDCDDSDPTISPNAEEVWYDGVDSNCDGGNDFDADGDGHVPLEWGGTDCNDAASTINPDAEEIWYDGVDQNCDMWSDFDADFDGHESNTYTYGKGGTDCDDANGSVNPDAEEVYYDDVDDNCNPADDFDADGDGYYGTGQATSLSFWSNYLGPDCDDSNADINPDAEEVWYDGTDSNCDEASDFDADGDGYISAVYGGDDCNDTLPLVYPGAPNELWYDGIDQNCDGWSDFDQDLDGYDAMFSGGEDCDDTDASINPDGIEIERDGIDQDCDGALEFDDDGDGHDGVEDNGDDCDDDDPAINPSAPEIWYDGIDQDCDEQSDFDADRDGHDAEAYGGDDCDDTDNTIHPNAIDYYYDGIDNDCDGLNDYDHDGDGYPAYYFGGDDCNDNNPLISPAATEVFYDGIDQNCDNLSDYDADGDGQDSIVYNGDDCNDSDATIYWQAPEIAFDGIDQNCDGVDDVDADNDGFFYSQDCDDSDPTIYPGAPDACYDGIDSNCLQDYDFDCDHDLIPAQAFGGNDCNDLNPYISPMQLETYYDGIDQNCDGLSDYDADQDGYDSYLFGGTDCEDNFDTIHPGNTFDGCGGGNEDCDDEIDEDCAENTSDTDSPEEATDTGDVQDTSAPQDTAEDTSLEDTAIIGEPSVEPSVEPSSEGTDTGSSSSGNDDSGAQESEDDLNGWEPPPVDAPTIKSYEKSGCSCSGDNAGLPFFWILIFGICIGNKKYPRSIGGLKENRLK